MKSRRGRLDRLLARHLQISRDNVRPMLAEGRIMVNGQRARHADSIIGPFDSVVVDGRPVQQAEQPVYLMLNKPAGIVSATRDDTHRTVIDLVRASPFAGYAGQLHIAGRLDATSTGLLLLTNDGRWSRALCAPGSRLEKHYRVTLQQPASEEDIAAFARGMTFDYEGIVTQPARLILEDGAVARVSLVEGRYHQIRRMFARCGNRVLTLHRYAIGPWHLPDDLAQGEVREVPDPKRLFHAIHPPDGDTSAHG